MFNSCIGLASLKLSCTGLHDTCKVKVNFDITLLIVLASFFSQLD